MSYHQRQLGVVPSPQDYRDYKLTRVTAVKQAFPAEYTYPYLVPEPYDQGDVGACVAYALKAIKRCRSTKAPDVFQVFCRLYLWERGPDDFRERYDPAGRLEHSLLKQGDCHEEQFPGIYPYPICASKITPEMNQDALPRESKPIPPYILWKRPKPPLWSLVLYVLLFLSTELLPGRKPALPNKDTEKLFGFHMQPL